MGGGKYAVFFAPKSPDTGLIGVGGDGESDRGGDDRHVEEEERDSPERDHVVVDAVDVVAVGDEGGFGKSIPSRSPGSSVISPSSSSSVEGKKLRKRAS